MKRESRIIEILAKQPTYMSLDEMADFFGVTTRTIRYDIEKTKKILKGTPLKIIFDKDRGIKIDGDINNKHVIQKIINNIKKNNNYYVDSERTKLILQKLFLSNKPCTILELAELTKTSKTTVLKNIDEIEKWLGNRNIKLIRNQKGIYLSYQEIDLRNAILEYISLHYDSILIQVLYDTNDDQKLFIFDSILNSFLKSLSKYNYNNSINKFIRKFELLENTNFTDEAYLNSYFMICIALIRINCKKNIPSSKNISLIKQLSNYNKWIHEYKKEFEKNIKTIIPEDEFYTILSFLQVQNKRNANTYSEKDKLLVRDFIKAIQVQLNINLLNDEILYESLLIHLTQMVNRATFSINVLTPPVKEDVKYLYYDIYKACKNTKNFFKKNIGVVPNDDEMAYLTIHIAASIERQKLSPSKQKKTTALIVCVSGIGTSNLLNSRVSNEFPNIIVKKVCSVKEFEKYNSDDIDLIISTTPLFEGNKKCVYVSPLLSDSDIEQIKKQLKTEDDTNDKDKTIDIYELINIVASECTVNDQQKLYEKLASFFNIKNEMKNLKGQTLSDLAIKEHVSLNVEAKDYKEAISVSGELLLNTQTINKNFINSMIRSKELLGPNIVISKGLAFPHAKPEDGAYKLGMSFVTLKSPVEFGNKEFDPVKLIISLSATDKKSHLKALSELMTLVTHSDVLDKLANAHTYDDFISELVSFENIYCKKL